jgi:xanthine/CO dehydrogenase XdhC/CoxF family maturation factor
MHDSEWSHRHVTEAELNRLNRPVGADLKLTEAEVQAAMAFAAAQIPHD